MTILAMSEWQLSPKAMVRHKKRWIDWAMACVYASGVVIISSQLLRRRDKLGIWVYRVTFCLFNAILIWRGFLLGRDWEIDSIIIAAFTPQDVEAK